MSSQLLTGVRVLDLTNVLAGPFAGYQLALLGADAALNRRGMGTSFLTQNAGKRSLSLNLKSEDSKAFFRRLVASADVVLENIRPGVMDRLGLGYEALREVRDDLVYCAISGFGQSGPLAAAPAYDQIIQGRSGVMSVTGDAHSAPLRVGYPVCDTVGGITAAFAISSALVRRQRDGTGGFIDVSILDSAIVTMGWIVSNQLSAGRSPTPMGNDNFTASPSGTFRTREGLLNIAANEQEQFEALCGLLGAPELVSDPRFAEREARKLNRAALTEALERHLAAHDAPTWETRLNQAGVPAGRVRDVSQALAQPQVAHRELTMTLLIDDPERDSITVTRSGFQVDGAPQSVAHGPPTLGQHNDEILLEAGFTMNEIAAWRANGTIEAQRHARAA